MSKSSNSVSDDNTIDTSGIVFKVCRPSKSPLTLIILGFAFQFMVLVTMIAIPFVTKLTGDTVVLRIAPVDPRDLFRGDYVILNYEIAQMPPNAISGSQPYASIGKTVFVSIEPDKDGKLWRATNYSLEKPTSGKFIRGRIKNWNRAEFGIESYFVQEGSGLAYENAARNRLLVAEIALSKNGDAVLRRLVIDENPSKPQVPPVVLSPKRESSVEALTQLHWQAERRFRDRYLDEKAFAEKAKEAGTIVLDTRNPDENPSFRIKGSLCLPKADFTYEELKAIVPNTDTNILLFSDSNMPAEPSNQTRRSQPENGIRERDIGLSMPIAMRLYFFGYRNVWELRSIVDPTRSRLDYEEP